MNPETLQDTIENWTKEPDSARGTPTASIRVTTVEATVKCDTDARSLLGICGAEPDLRNLSLGASVEPPDGDAAVKQFAEVWEKRCTIYLALAKPMDVALQFQAA